MSVKVAGFVEKVFPKAGQNGRGHWLAYSIKLQKADGNVDPMYYQFGFVDGYQGGTPLENFVPIKAGDYVEFEAEPKDDKAMTAVKGTARKPKNAPAKPAAPAQSSGGGYKGKGGGGYKPREPVKSAIFGNIGQNSTEDDIKRISLASARTAAIELVSVLLANDGLVTSAAATKAGQASRYEEIVAAVDKLTVKYFFDSATGRLLESVADEGTKATRVAELPTEQPSKAKGKKAAAKPAADEPPADDDADFDDSDNLDQIGAEDDDSDAIN